jgi:GTPase SAR1 family protein
VIDFVVTALIASLKAIVYCFSCAANVYRKELTICGHRTELQIFDVSTQHDEDEDGNDSSYTFCTWSDGFVLVYSVTDANSLKAAVELKREIDSRRRFRPAHFILVGNKSDLVQHRRVSERDGRSAAETLGCCFTEASARDGTAVEDAFERAVRTVGTKLRRNSIIGVTPFPSSPENRKKKIPFLSKAKAKLGSSTPVVLAMGLSGKRLSVYSEPRPLTMKAITTLRRASVA